MRVLTLLLLPALLLAAAPPGLAGAYCGEVVDVAGVAYVVIDDYYGPTVYLETNGEPGLQCADHENPDMQLF